MNEIEEKLYAMAAQEVASKRFHPALIAKALADADGDERKTIARYIKLRVQHLAEEYTRAQAAQAEARERAEVARRAEERRRAAGERRRAMEPAREQDASNAPGIQAKGRLFFPPDRTETGGAGCFFCCREGRANELWRTEDGAYAHLDCVRKNTKKRNPANNTPDGIRR